MDTSWIVALDHPVQPRWTTKDGLWITEMAKMGKQRTSSRLLCFFLVSVAGLADMLLDRWPTRGEEGLGEEAMLLSLLMLLLLLLL